MTAGLLLRGGLYEAPVCDLKSSANPYWQEPTTGNATRRPALKNNKTARGFTSFRGIVVYHESELEHRVSTLLQARTDLVELHSQYPVMSYVDANNVARTHTFDYFAVLNSGRRVAIAVKEFKKKREMSVLLDQIRESGLLARCDNDEFKPSLVDDVILITDVDANMDAYLNATDILRARDFYNQADHTELQIMIRDFPGRFRFGELFRNYSNHARRWTAAWALIEHGNIRPVEPGRISEVTWMTVAR